MSDTVKPAAAPRPARGRHVVASVSEIAPGQSKLVTVKGREIGVFNVNGEFFALLNRCPHEGASLCAGKIVSLVESDEPGQYRMSRRGELLRCPWHGWEFDIRTGQSWCDPKNTWVKQFAAAVEPGSALAKGPYVAETFPVSVEQDYVVIEL
ncbi:Rieske (2Fe-2S) protein [Roseomonas sp. BN140053]|uniref:Rieske (2Fe-2S) protein n=1 Tax=Roseomonas sp. BN140053 TaxID=3391898 RepID=UPI0039EC1000